MARIILSQNGLLGHAYFNINQPLLIGRAPESQVLLEDDMVSPNHALIFSEQDSNGIVHFFIEDLNSQHGSFVNRQRVTRNELKHRDVIRIGPHQFTFYDHKATIARRSQ